MRVSAGGSYEDKGSLGKGIRRLGSDCMPGTILAKAGLLGLQEACQAENNGGYRNEKDLFA